jgi:hypothetical protein
MIYWEWYLLKTLNKVMIYSKILNYKELSHIKMIKEGIKSKLIIDKIVKYLMIKRCHYSLLNHALIKYHHNHHLSLIVIIKTRNKILLCNKN